MNMTELHLIREAIYHQYGYDFRNYAESSFQRRIQAAMARREMHDGFEFLRRIVKEPDFFRKLLPELTVSTTELFRDPEMFKALREKIFPVLRTYPHLNIWVAGCSTGEEVYSLSILLNEEGLAKRSTIYATDINPLALDKARKGVYSLQAFRSFVKNYTLAGGQQAPSDYYIAEYSTGRFHSQLRENVVFEEHNLVTDQSFREMHLIMCRNVLIYFNRELHDKVLQLFYDSLVSRGFLVLGTKETIRFSQHQAHYNLVDQSSRIYQKSRFLEKKVGNFYEA